MYSPTDEHVTAPPAAFAADTTARRRPSRDAVAPWARLRILRVVELVLVNVSTAVALTAAAALSGGEVSFLALALALATSNTAWFFAGEVLDLYRLSTAASLPSTRFAATGTILATVLASAATLSMVWPAAAAAMHASTLAVSLSMALLVSRARHRATADPTRVVLVGATESRHAMAAVIAAEGGGSIESLGSFDGLNDVAERLVAGGDVDMVIADSSTASKAFVTRLEAAHPAIAIAGFAEFCEQLAGRIPLTAEHEFAGPIHPDWSWVDRAAKRISDLILVSAGFAFLFVAAPFIILAIKLDSPGPIFYYQDRIGLRGRRFRAYKFRSMVANAESGKAVWARVGDPRVTRVGRLLRRTHVDEFPQFLNILKGEMSVVGPRPERPEFVEQLVRDIPHFDRRHAVKPGMAGWALVRQGYGDSVEGAALKLEYDLYYVKHHSIWFDTVILLKTVVDTVTFRGRA